MSQESTHITARPASVRAIKPPVRHILPESQHLHDGPGLTDGIKHLPPLGPPLIQPKLKIGAPNDKYEQEADRVAEQVMRAPQEVPLGCMPDPGAVQTHRSPPQIQRLCPECEDELQRKPLAQIMSIQAMPIVNTITPLVQRQDEPDEEEEYDVPDYDEKPQQVSQAEPEGPFPVLESVDTRDAEELGEEEDEEELIRSKRFAGTRPTITPNISQAIHSLKGGGQPLPATERAFFEPRFGRDFSRVRVHADHHAAQMAQSINACAFTLGHDVVFGASQYSPGTSYSRRLLAHELTHVVQQHGGTYGMKRAQIPHSSFGIDTLDDKSVKLTETRQHALSTTLANRYPLTSAPLEIQRTALGQAIVTNAEKRWNNRLLRIFYNNFIGAIVPNDKWPRGIGRDQFLWVAGEMKKPKVRRAYFRAIRRVKRGKRRLTKNEKWFQRLWDRYRLVSRYDKQLAHFPVNDYYIDYGGNKCNLFVFDAVWDAGKHFALNNGHYPGPVQVGKGVPGLKRITNSSQVEKGDIFWEQGHVGLVRWRKNRYRFRSIEWYNPVRSVDLPYVGYRFYRVK